MAQSVGSGKSETPKGEVTNLGTSKLVVQNVEVVKIREVIRVPEFVTEEIKVTKYVPIEEPTTKYITKTEDTTKYNTVEKDTTKFNVRTEDTVKYSIIEKECEKPVPVDTPYERPIIVEKEYALVKYTDITLIRELMETLPKLLEVAKKFKDIKVVEEIIKVPRINYIPTDVYKMTTTGELIKDADSSIRPRSK